MTLYFFIQLFIGLIVVFILSFGLALFELYTQVGRYGDYWKQQNKVAIKQDNLVYVALGDSTAQGIGATRPDNGYVGLVARGLEKKYDQKVSTLNFSKTGAKLRDALDRQLPELEKLRFKSKPKITIEIGANDMIHFSSRTFEKEMDQLMSRLPAQTIISDVPYFGGSRYKSKQSNVVEANKIMYKLAKKHGFRLAKLHDQIKSDQTLKVFAVDWFHPSNYAYRTNWAPVFLERL